MLGSMSWDRLFMLLVAALVVLGPDRLPGAVSWATRTLGQVRDAVNGAADQAKTQFGPNWPRCANP
jgi:sec-independent protein translocase protein TatB